MGFNMLIPEMNDYISSLGGEDYKWLILGLWTVAAAISRPFSGKIADNISRKRVMYIGLTISIIISFLYPFFISIAGFLTLRFLHGFSTGFHPTGASAIVADVIPKGKRGEAMGIFGIMLTLGFTSGQAMGSTIKNAFSVDGLFYACGILGIISFVLLTFIKEDKNIVRQNAEEKGYHKTWQKVIPKWDEIVGPEVIHPTLVMFLTANIAGLYFLLVPEYSKSLGIENKGLFWLTNVVIVIITRFVSGKLVDKFGARNNLIVSLIFLLMACLMTGMADTKSSFLLSSLIFGIGSAISSPAIMSWTADLANPIYKGRGMGTMFIALELGFLSGNFFGQHFYQNDPSKLIHAFQFGAVLMIVGLVYLILIRKSKAVQMNAK